jgi:hypothetical protein
MQEVKREGGRDGLFESVRGWERDQEGYFNIYSFDELTCLLWFLHIYLGFLFLLEYTIIAKGYTWRLIAPATTIISTLPPR